VPCASDLVTVAKAASRLPELYASPKAAARLVSQVLQEQRVHRTLQTDVQVRDVALGESNDADAGEGETLEQTGSVFLVTAKAIQRFREDDIETPIERVAHQRLKAGTQEGGARYRMIGEFLRNDPSLSRGELPADAELVGDRGVALVVR
jgi:hypothetical protein